MTHAAAPAAFLGVPRVPHVPYTPKCLPPGIFQDQVQITAAMNLLHAGVDTSTIALWLGHAGTRATQAYLHADLALKEAALSRISPPAARRVRYHPPDHLLAFLEGL